MSRNDFFRKQKIRKRVTTFLITLTFVIITCVTVFVMYSKKLEDSAENDLLALGKQEDELLENDKTEETSFSNDKTVENNINFQNVIEVEINNSANSVSENTTISKEVVEPIVDSKKIIENTIQENNQIEENIEDELEFQAPVSGEIIKDYAMDILVYSDTLEEWCTHSGIDIKANKSSIVTASEKGVVESIKTDPRYGLTIIISHTNGFKTVYANLLSTEFVSEGESVDKGQTIATVGESASFEVADEPHLHFEIYKDGLTVNPTLYFK